MSELAFYIDPLDAKLPQRLLWLRERGVAHVGFDGMGREEPGVLERVRQAVGAAGLQVVAIHGEPPLIAEEGQEQALWESHLHVLERASFLRPRYVVLHYGIAPQTVAPDEHRQKTLALLRPLAEEARNRGLILALENLPPQYPLGCRISSLVSFLRELNLPNVRFCLDSGHAHLADEDIPASIRLAGDLLVTTHLHDNYGAATAGGTVAQCDRHLSPGLGTINWPEIIRAFAGSGFPGPVTFEGVRTTPHGQELDFETGVEITLANWAAFERIASS